MKKIVLLLVMLLVLLSCNNGKSRLLFAVHEIDFVNKSDITVKGTRVDVDLPMGVNSIEVCDSFFIVMFYNGGPLMSVYSHEWELLGRFCYKGRGRNEFNTEPRMISAQTLRGENGNTLIPFLEGNFGIKVMDLQQSLQSQKTAIVMEKEYLPYTVIEAGKIGEDYYTRTRPFDFVILNNDINQTFRSHLPIMDQDEISYGKDFDVMYDGEQQKYFKMFSSDCATDFDYAQNYLHKHPGRNLIIAPIYNMDYILFFDLDNDRTFAIHQSGSRSYDDELSPIEYQQIQNNDGSVSSLSTTPSTFEDCIGTESFFIVKYYSGDYSVNQPDFRNAAPELLFFDWDGNFLKSVMLDVNIGNISYDEITQTLYGVDVANDCILSFDLSPVVACF